jgi:hypothetical protein
MVGKIPFMSISDKFSLVLAIIIVDHGDKFLNIGEDSSLVIDFDCVFLPNCVWSCLGLFINDPMAPRAGRAKDFVVRKNIAAHAKDFVVRKTRVNHAAKEEMTHYQSFVPP